MDGRWIVVGIIAVAACGPNRAARRELAQHRATWRAHALHDYSFDYRRQCFFCTAEEGDSVRIHVQGDSVARVVSRSSGAPIRPREGVQWPTIEGLFDLADATMRAKNTTFSVRYDSTLGYPVELSTSPTNVTDAGMSHRIGNLRAGVDATPTAPPAGPTQLSASCGGGITGGSRGVSLARDGALYRWNRPTAGAPAESTFVRSDPALAAAAFAELDAMRFPSIAYDNPSNVTCSLRARGGGAEHSVSWGIADGKAPTRVRELFDRIRAADPGGGR
jgi:uncharacterized protein DUF6174